MKSEVDMPEQELQGSRIMETNELKPCPFCGGKAELIHDPHGNQFLYWARCDNIGCTVCPEAKMTANKEDAIDAWNRREGENV
jgi:Lar family restriction alleviation protein